MRMSQKHSEDNPRRPGPVQVLGKEASRNGDFQPSEVGRSRIGCRDSRIETEVGRLSVGMIVECERGLGGRTWLEPGLLG
jgi:hypothetical protein